MLTVIRAISTALTLGMDFSAVLDVVSGYTDVIDVTMPDADTFGYIVVGSIYGYSLTLDFDDDDRLISMDFDSGDWD